MKPRTVAVYSVLTADDSNNNLSGMLGAQSYRSKQAQIKGSPAGTIYGRQEQDINKFMVFKDGLQCLIHLIA